MSILEQIIQVKKKEIEGLCSKTSLEEAKKRANARAKPLSFANALRNTNSPAIIAEIKKASPSKGIIREDLDPVETANEYISNGAACLSVLTDKQFFSGNLEFIPSIKKSQKDSGKPIIPILRKEFIIHPVQIWESREAGADAVLLIAAVLDAQSLELLTNEALTAELDVLLEVHNEEELNKALPILNRMLCSYSGDAEILLGINNRNLDTFTTKLSTTKALAEIWKSLSTKTAMHPSLKKSLLVSESGIFTAEDLHELSSYGACAFLVGESLVAKGNPGENLAQLIKQFSRKSGKSL